MWKIFIEYDDKSKITLTGKHKDIPLRLALEYNLPWIIHGVAVKVAESHIVTIF